MAYTWFVLLLAGSCTALLLLLLQGTPIGVLIHERIPDRPRRRMFVATVSFFLVFGILLLLAVGYAWLAEIGTGDGLTSLLASRLLAILYGVGAALTLDEFATWLNLRDVYWAKEGRASLDAVVLFGALLAAGAWGAPLFSGRAGKPGRG